MGADEGAAAPLETELALPAPLPPGVAVATAPGAESVVEADWVPLKEVAVALAVAGVVAFPLSMAPPTGFPSAVTENYSNERLGI